MSSSFFSFDFDSLFGLFVTELGVYHSIDNVYVCVLSIQLGGV